jgi:hypothetical protein
MRYKHIFLLVAALLMTANVSAQSRGKMVAETEVKDTTSMLVKAYMDSLQLMRLQLDSLEAINNRLRQESDDGRYFRLFAPTTFYHSGADKSLSLTPQGDEVSNAIDAAMMNIYMRRPDLIRNNESNLRRVGSVRGDVNQEMSQKVDLTNMAEPLPEESEAIPVQLMVQKPNFWKFKGEG